MDWDSMFRHIREQEKRGDAKWAKIYLVGLIITIILIVLKEIFS
jgi:hypothetical protein